MKDRDFAIALLTITLAACQNPPRGPVARAGLAFNNLNRNALLVPPPTVTPTQEFNAKTFLERISASQLRLKATHKYETPSGAHLSKDIYLGSTLIDMAGTMYEGYFLSISAAHGFSWQGVGNLIEGIIKGQPELNSITLDDTITLERNNFGLSYEDQQKGGDKADWAFLLIDKNDLKEDELSKLTNASLPFSSILFDSLTSTQGFYGICTPESENPYPIIANNAKYVDNFNQNYIEINPWPVVKSCSGTGAFTPDESNNPKDIGIVVRGDQDTAVVYPFSEMGRSKLFENIGKAYADLNSH